MSESTAERRVGKLVSTEEKVSKAGKPYLNCTFSNGDVLKAFAAEHEFLLDKAGMTLSYVTGPDKEGKPFFVNNAEVVESDSKPSAPHPTLIAKDTDIRAQCIFKRICDMVAAKISIAEAIEIAREAWNGAKDIAGVDPFGE